MVFQHFWSEKWSSKRKSHGFAVESLHYKVARAEIVCHELTAIIANSIRLILVQTHETGKHLDSPSVGKYGYGWRTGKSQFLIGKSTMNGRCGRCSRVIPHILFWCPSWLLQTRLSPTWLPLLGMDGSLASNDASLRNPLLGNHLPSGDLR